MCLISSAATLTRISRLSASGSSSGFGGDRWQVSPKLTVDLGLRWEFYSSRHTGFPRWFLQLRSHYQRSGGWLESAATRRTWALKKRYNYFAPRIGLAYRFTEKTVVRAGFGTSYTPFEDNT